MTMEMFRDLPKDLVEEEILTHVPATYLKGLGSTCKRWNRLFNGDRRFARKHTEKAAKQFVVLMLTRAYRICPTIVDLDGEVPSLEVKSELSLVDPKYPAAQFRVGVVFHCDGLLLCTSADESRFVVWNPFTGETRWVQPSYRGVKYRFFVIGYGKNKSYKVLSFYQFKKDYEIYELSSDRWRVVDEIIAPGWRLGYSSINVSLKGSTYCFALDETKTQTSISLVKFDYSTEKFVPVALPYESKGFAVVSLSVVKEEKLSVLLQRQLTSKTEIWVSNKVVDENETTPQVVSWSMVLALDLSSDLQVYFENSYLLDEDKKVVMITVNLINLEDENDTKYRDMVCIVGEDNQVTQVDFGIEETYGCHAAILNYVPSLVRIERPGGKRKRADI